jgi:hypothetical protein
MTANTDGGPGATMRCVWGLLGLFFTFITGKVLLADVQTYADLGTDHLLTIGALVGAIVSGVFFGPLLRRAKVIAALGLALSFSAATVYCLIGSAGRGDELAYEKNAEARKTNETRARYMRDRDEAKRRWATAQDAEAAECASGVAQKCKGRQATTAQTRHAFEIADILVRQSGPEARENGKLQRASELWVLARGGDVKDAEKALALLWPFLPPAICELLSIIFWHQCLQFRHKWQWRLPNWRAAALPDFPRLPSPTVTDAVTVPVTAQTTVATPEQAVVSPVSRVATATVRKPRPKRKRPTDVQLMHEAIENLGGVAHSQNHLADYWAVSKGEVAKRVEACGDFLNVRRVGRCHEIRINDAYEYI